MLFSGKIYTDQSRRSRQIWGKRKKNLVSCVHLGSSGKDGTRPNVTPSQKTWSKFFWDTSSYVNKNPDVFYLFPRWLICMYLALGTMSLPICFFYSIKTERKENMFPANAMYGHKDRTIIIQSILWSRRKIVSCNTWSQGTCPMIRDLLDHFQQRHFSRAPILNIYNLGFKWIGTNSIVCQLIWGPTLIAKLCQPVANLAKPIKDVPQKWTWSSKRY